MSDTERRALHDQIMHHVRCWLNRSLGQRARRERERERFIPLKNSRQLAREYGITPEQVRNVASGRHWSWLA